MKPKLKPDLDLESVQSDLIDTICSNYKIGVSVRALAKQFNLSPMKVRKILITGGVYETDTSIEINELWKDGKTVKEIAELLEMTTANVNSYLPYERIVYNMGERSVEADRQQRYRDRKKGLLPPVEEKKRVEVERVRNKTMIIIIGKKLRRLLPEKILDESSDPLAREKSYTWGTNVGGEFVLHEPKDPDKNIWCAEVTTAGRGKGKKQGVVLMNANCGFAVMSSLPTASAVSEEQDAKVYREKLEEVFMDAIRSGMLDFALPEDKVLDYTDTVSRIELIKGKRSAPGVRLEEFIERELNWESGDDPVKQYNIRSNWTNRKFGNSGDYRKVDEHICNMLGMGEEECQIWMQEFLKPITKTINREGI